MAWPSPATWSAEESFVGWARAAAKLSPRPPTTRRKGACMGSYPTLDHRELAAEARELGPGDSRQGHAVARLATEHPQVRDWPDDHRDLAHRDRIYDHPDPTPQRAGEQAFDRLNPDFGVPADRSDRIGRRDVQQREAALALGVRVAVHDSRQNDRNPVIWQPGQDYRTADAIHAARTTRIKRGPERTGHER
jgi:hypothetical protein